MSNTTFPSDSFSLLVRDLQGDYRPASGDEVLRAARHVLGQRVRRGTALTSPRMVRDYLWIKLTAREHEVFAVLMLDAQHRVIEYQEMFRGTVTQTSVYPREVVKETLARNAAAVIFAQNVNCLLKPLISLANSTANVCRWGATVGAGIDSLVQPADRLIGLRPSTV